MWLDIVKEVLLPYAGFTGRLFAALFFGAMIGLERQKRQRRAGLRTNALVALGSASFASLSVLIEDDASPTRIISQVVSGVGFLGAGAILRDGMSVRGLNTAATLWSAAAVGALSGTGFVIHGFITAFFVVFAHVVLRPIGYRIDLQKSNQPSVSEVVYQAEIICQGGQEGYIRTLLLQTVGGGLLQLRKLRSYDLIDDAAVVSPEHHKILLAYEQRQQGKENDEDNIHNTLIKIEAEFVTTGRRDNALENLVSHLSLEPSVSEVSWSVITQS
jgi:putative Mg2+ transporter-C (MgtC) family protein